MPVSELHHLSEHCVKSTLRLRRVLVHREEFEFHENKTVTFKEHRVYTYDEENTLPESTVITTVNIPLMVGRSRTSRDRLAKISDGRIFRAPEYDFLVVPDLSLQTQERESTTRQGYQGVDG